jgi:hypothetical protein
VNISQESCKYLLSIDKRIRQYLDILEIRKLNRPVGMATVHDLENPGSVPSST